MNVLYEEDGTFKVGAVLADHDTSLQVEAPHGKRSKVKAANVLLRFDGRRWPTSWSAPSAAAAEIDIDFLWECCGEAEFGFDDPGARVLRPRAQRRSRRRRILLGCTARRSTSIARARAATRPRRPKR